MMERMMKRIVFTTVGQAKYLEVLVKYLIRDKEAGAFDEWHLWINTEIEDDIYYVKALAQDYDWIKIIDEPTVGSLDKTAVYLKISEKIVYVDAYAINMLLTYREMMYFLDEYFLIFGNTVNNAICGHLHQRFGCVSHKHGHNNYSATDPVGWKNPDYAIETHNNFLLTLENEDYEMEVPYIEQNNQYIFPLWELWGNEPFSADVMAFFGRDGDEFGSDNELWPQVYNPCPKGRINVIHGSALFSKFATPPQEEELLKTDILDRYKKLAEKL